MLILRRLFLSIAILPVLVATRPAQAGVVPIGPFTGTNSENFDHLGVEGAPRRLASWVGSPPSRT